jgi:hypothetical protein
LSGRRGGGAETPVRGYVLTRGAENHDSVIRNATQIHVMHSSLSSFFQEPDAGCNNKEMALHQVYCTVMGLTLCTYFSHHYKNVLIISRHRC